MKFTHVLRSFHPFPVISVAAPKTRKRKICGKVNIFSKSFENISDDQNE